MVRLIYEQVRAVVGHAILGVAAALASNAACRDDHVTAAEERINILHALRNVGEHADDRVFCLRRQHGTARLLQYSERQEFIGYLDPQRMRRHDEQQARTAGRNKHR